MMIKDFDFGSIHAVRKQCWTYKADGNTPIKKGKNLYPLKVITGCDDLKGFFVEVIKNKYDDATYKIWNDLGNSCVKYGNFHPAFNMENVKEIKEMLLPYKDIEGFRKKLLVLKERNDWIRNTEILALAENGYAEEAKIYQEYHDRLKVEREEEEHRRHEEYERQEQEREQRRQEEIAAQIERAEQNIKDRKDFKNELIDGKSIVLYMMNKYGIKVPTRTQGWFNQKLAYIRWDGEEITYSYYRTKGTNGSLAAFKYLYMLEDAVNAA